MATKTSKTPAPKSPPTKGTMVATFPDAPDVDKANAMAKMAMRPSVNAAVVMSEYTQPLGAQDVNALVHTLADSMEGMWAGDMKRSEAMLYGQAHALQSIFMNLARRATKQEYLKNWEAYLRMALKAQNQCRMTLETLATIKNPPVVFARQANINNGGQQQVNNGVSPPSGAVHAGAHAHAATATELLEDGDGQRLDTGATGAASGADSKLETVGAVHRPAQRGREGTGLAQRRPRR
jgi:hypothetical protein